MKSIFKKIASVFSALVFMFSNLFFSATAHIIVERNPDNSIRLIRYETQDDVEQLRNILKRLKDIFLCAIRENGYNQEIYYEEIWTFLAMQYIPTISRNYDYKMSKFLTNFIFKDYRSYRNNLYGVRFGDLYARVLDILEYVADSDCIEIEMATVSEEV